MSFAEADKITGGVLALAADHLVAGRKLAAAAALSELAQNLMTEASDAFQAERNEDLGVDPLDEWAIEGAPQVDPGALAQALASCARGVHQWGDVDHRGWRKCAVCEQTWVAGG